MRRRYGSPLTNRRCASNASGTSPGILCPLALSLVLYLHLAGACRSITFTKLITTVCSCLSNIAPLPRQMAWPRFDIETALLGSAWHRRLRAEPSFTCFELDRVYMAFKIVDDPLSLVMASVRNTRRCSLLFGCYEASLFSSHYGGKRCPGFLH